MIDGINHLTLSVKNIDDSFKFYKDVLGLIPVMKSSFSAYLMAGNIWIALIEEDKQHCDDLYSHIAFNISEYDFKIIEERLNENNVKIWQDNKTEGDSIYFNDPSGNKLEIHYSSLYDRMALGKRKWNDVKWYI